MLLKILFVIVVDAFVVVVVATECPLSHVQDIRPSGEGDNLTLVGKR